MSMAAFLPERIFGMLTAAYHLNDLSRNSLQTPHHFLRSDKTAARASLVAQWLRICLLMQGTRVRALVWEDPTCRGAAGPVSHNC